MKSKNLFIIFGVLLVLLLTAGAVLTMLAVSNAPNTPDLPDEPSDDVIDNGETYNVSLMLLGATNSNTDYTIAKGEKLSVAITADTGYFLAQKAIVTGANHTWTVSADLKSAVLELSNPSGDVTVSVTAINTVKIKYTVIDDTSGGSVTYDVVECPESFTSGGSGNFVINICDAKIGRITGDPEFMFSRMSDEGGNSIVFLEWDGQLYPADGVLNFTVTIVDEPQNVMLNLSNCTVTNVHKS